MLVLVFREEEENTAAFIIIIIMRIITFQALSCSLHFPINRRPRACLEIAVVTQRVGRIFFLFLFFWELELMHLPISMLSTVFVVLKQPSCFSSKVSWHGFYDIRALWPKCRGQIFEPTKAELLWRVGMNYFSLFWLQSKISGHSLRGLEAGPP